MAFNPLATILKENKLDGTNYIDWKRNLDIVLTAEDCKFVLINLCPPKPYEGATEQEAKPYEKWLRLMRCRGVIFWLLCQIFYNININLCPQPMI